MNSSFKEVLLYIFLLNALIQLHAVIIGNYRIKTKSDSALNTALLILYSILGVLDIVEGTRTLEIWFYFYESEQ